LGTDTGKETTAAGWPRKEVERNEDEDKNNSPSLLFFKNVSLSQKQKNSKFGVSKKTL
jgi:hypothetical protein